MAGRNVHDRVTLVTARNCIFELREKIGQELVAALCMSGTFVQCWALRFNANKSTKLDSTQWTGEVPKQPVISQLRTSCQGASRDRQPIE